MSSKPTWRSSLPFSARFETISRITEAQSKGKGLHIDAARKEAQSLEKHYYDSSPTLEEYERECRQASQICTTLAVEEPSSEDEAITSKAVQNIGRYYNAKHHRDGLFSFVLKTFKSSEVDCTYGEMVALKVTKPATMPEPHNSKREARILKSINHNRIIPLREAFKDRAGVYVLVFPFVRYDLASLLRKHRIDEDQARSHIQDMFSALAALHAAGIIHRDIKPSNILLISPSGPAYLADFGIAWSSRDSASEAPENKITDVGTGGYRPPELLFGNKKYDCSLDIWAAGCVVAEVSSLSGDPLFDSGDLGSELALVQSIFKTLGTPNLKTWPEAANFPDWGKMAFREFPKKPWAEILPRASDMAQDLVCRLVRYESGERLSAQKALCHPYLAHLDDDRNSHYRDLNTFGPY